MDFYLSFKRPTPRIVIGSNPTRAPTVGQFVKTTQQQQQPQPQPGQKQENLYIVALPDHLKRPGGTGVVQYAAQVGSSDDRSINVQHRQDFNYVVKTNLF